MTETDNTYPLFVDRPGVPPLKYKSRHAIDARIEKIGQLADRHKDCAARRDYWGMIELSYDYDRMKYMHKTAAMIRTEAAVLQRMEDNGTEISQRQ